MLAGKPIGSKGQLLIQWLFKTKLPASAVRSCDDVSSEVISAEGDSRSAPGRLAHLGINVIPGVVSTMTNGDEEVIANDEGPAVIPFLDMVST